MPARNPIDHGLFEILASYGVRPEKNLIVDPQCKRINVETRQGAFQVRNVINYPYFPSLTDLNRKEMLTKDIGSVSLPFMSSLTIIQNKATVDRYRAGAHLRQELAGKGALHGQPHGAQGPSSRCRFRAFQRGGHGYREILELFCQQERRGRGRTTSRTPPKC